MDEMRNAITRAVRHATSPSGTLMADRARPQLPPLPRDLTLAGRETLVERFRAELERLTGKVYGPVAPDDAAGVVVDIVRSLGASQALAWDDAALPVPGFAAVLGEGGMAVTRPEVPPEKKREQVLAALAGFEVGVTGAVAGVADTGSIIVATGPGRARVVSLLPPVHVALLPVSRLYATLSDWLVSDAADLARAAANVVVITGPSRTADIELVISLGVHGPKEVHVVLVEG